MADTPQSLTMYDPETGDPVQVDPRQAGELYRSGKATFAQDQDVPILGKDGRVTVMKGADAGAYLASPEALAVGGAASQAQLERQQKEDQYGGLGGGAAAALAGAARGATLGLSDLALTKTGLVDPSTLKSLEEVNPLLSVGGEAAGMIAPLLVSGGGAAAAEAGALARAGSTAARVATAPARGAMALGRGAEAVGTAILGEGTAARIATGAASAAVEGSLFGIGQEVSRTAIQDVDLTAERMLAAAGHGALLGGAVGGGASALGALARGAASKAGDAGASLLGRLEQREAQLGAELAESAVPKAESTVLGMVDRFGREQALKATGGTTGQLERLQSMGRDVEDRVIKRLLDDAPEVLGKKPGSILSAAEKATAAERMVQRDGERVGQMIDDLSRAGEKADVAKLIATQREKVTADMLNAVSPDARKAATQFDEWLTSIEQKAGSGDIKELWAARKELRKDINWKTEAGSGDRYNDWKRELYRDLGNEIQAAGERAGPQLGPDFAARWKAANTDYRASLWLEEATARGAAANAKNRLFGLSEQLGVLGGIAVGGLAAAPLAIGGALVQNLVRRYGSDVAAQLARAATRGEAVHAVDQAIERIAGERVAALVGTAKKTVGELPRTAPGVAQVVEKAVRREQPAPEVPRGAVMQRYQLARKELLDGLADRQARLEASTAGLDDVAPGLGAAIRAKTTLASDFLASKLPKVPQRQSLQPHLEKERLPSPEEARRYLRYERAVSDPLSILEDARKGKLTVEAVEAVSTLYPRLLQAVRGQLMAEAAQKKERFSRQQRVQFDLLLGTSTEPDMQPHAMAQYQAIQPKAPPPNLPPGQVAPGAPPPAPRPFRAPQLATRTDQIGATA